MNEFYKAIAYLVFSFIVSSIANKLGSPFINNFSDGIISLLTTLLAINIASSSLIASKLKEINTATGHTFEKTRAELKRNLVVQLILIVVAFFLLIFRSSSVIINWIGNPTMELFANTITVGIFIYYLETIKDLGQALFSLIDFQKKE